MVNSGYRANSVSAAPRSEHTGGRCRRTGGRCVLRFEQGSGNRLGHHTTMGRKGETTKFKGAKPAPSEAAKKERERKKKRDREDEKDAERLGARARLNRSRPECPVCFDEVATHKLLPCSHNYCLEHAQECLQRGSCAICRQAPRFHQPLLNLADFSPRRPAERRFDPFLSS